MPFENYREYTPRTREEKLGELRNETKRIVHQRIVGQYEDLFNQFKNNWQEQQILYRGKAKYECLMQMHNEILEVPLSGCDKGNVVHFAQYTYLYSLQQFVRFLEAFTPNDEFYRTISGFGCPEEIIDIKSIGSLVKELRGLANLELKYHFGNMNEFDPVFLERLRKNYSSSNFGLGHAIDYSITGLSSFPPEKDIKAAFDGTLDVLK